MAKVHEKLVLEGNADAVEFCSTPHHTLLAAATYTLHSDLPQPHRVGSITLFDLQQQQQKPVLKQFQRLETCGVFDIKWRAGVADGTSPACLAQAGSDGSIVLYQLCEDCTPSTKSTGNPPRLGELARKQVSSSMCLSLDWEPFHLNSQDGLLTSHSNGWVTSMHVGQDSLHVDQTWLAHDFEAWTACFDCWKHNIVYSGGDDSHFCVWDLREDLHNPVHRSRRAHRMGVCCIQSNPLWEHVLVSGSYDEAIRVWDSRMLQSPLLMAELGVGGGVWKLKWHPNNKNLLLAACMHNGFAVLHANGSNLEVLEEYKDHASLAYGVDWYRGERKNLVELKDHIAVQETQLGNQSEVINNETNFSNLVATCSFYDSALHLWEPRIDLLLQSAISSIDE